MKQYLYIILLIAFLFSGKVYSQENSFIENDSIEVSDAFLTYQDSLAVDSLQLEKKIETESILPPTKRFVPNPTKAVIYSAIFPGLGQIYNRKYWKLPIVYGGFLGCAYAINWNNKTYVGYKNAYRDFMDNDPNTNSWRDYIRGDISGREDYFSNVLRNRRNSFRRYRDLSCFIAIGLYAICMIDAYVDAQLFEFDISEDLSLKVDPVIFDKTANNARSLGLQCSFTF